MRTNVARNARHRSDPLTGGLTREQAIAQFGAITLTSPERAAEIIHRGVAAGRSRMLVGPDAYLFDALARLAPAGGGRVLQTLEQLPLERLAALLPGRRGAAEQARGGA